MINSGRTCVVTAADKNFIPYMGGFFSSLNSNYTGSDTLDVYVLVPKDVLNIQIPPFERISVKFIYPEAAHSEENNRIVHKMYHGHYGNKRITSTSMYRFFMADLIPEYDKAVYLDSDILVARDISPMLSYNLKTPVAAYPEVQLEFNDNPYFRDTSYFNSGVMIANLSYWREKNVSYKLMQLSDAFEYWTGSYDQDILNALFKNNWTPLPMTFNYLINIYKNIDLKNPLIVHWAGKYKPWMSNCPESKWKQLWNQHQTTGPTIT